MGVSRPTTPNVPAELELHIEELVLHGFAAGDRFHIGDALQQELLRLFSEKDLPAMMASTGNIERMDGGTLKVASGAKPGAIGAQLAQTLHQRFSPEPRGQQPGGQQKETRNRR